jgi:Ricin-type beta-trefoil lectin domain
MKNFEKGSSMEKHVLSEGRLTRAVAGMSHILRVFAALPLLGMLAASSGTANAATLSIQGSANCANVSGANTANGTPVILWPCSSTFNEQWQYVDGVFHGIGTANGVDKCLDVKGDGTAPGTKVDLYTCNGGGNQQWIIENGPERERGLPASTL